MTPPTKPTSDRTTAKGAASGKDAKKDRKAKALRQNLLRRKAAENASGKP